MGANALAVWCASAATCPSLSARRHSTASVARAMQLRCCLHLTPADALFCRAAQCGEAHRARCSDGHLGNCGQMTAAICMAECSQADGCAYFSHLVQPGETQSPTITPGTCIICTQRPTVPVPRADVYVRWREVLPYWLLQRVALRQPPSCYGAAAPP